MFRTFLFAVVNLRASYGTQVSFFALQTLPVQHPLPPNGTEFSFLFFKYSLCERILAVLTVSTVSSQLGSWISLHMPSAYNRVARQLLCNFLLDHCLVAALSTIARLHISYGLD